MTMDILTFIALQNNEIVDAIKKLKWYQFKKRWIMTGAAVVLKTLYDTAYAHGSWPTAEDKLPPLGGNSTYN